MPERALLAALLLLAGPAGAIVGDRLGPIGLDGSFRTTTAVTYNYESPLFDERAAGFSQSALRLTLEGHPLDWLTFEIHGLQQIDFSTLAGSSAALGGLPGTAFEELHYRLADLAIRWGDEPHVQAKLGLDRLNLKLRLPFADVTLGRQAITFGKAYFWNPLDVFLAFDARQFDRDYKAGVDALRIEVPLGEAAGLTLVAALGRSDAGLEIGASYYGSAFLTRLYANVLGWDLTIQGGKIFGGYQIGAGATGELGPLAIRMEAAYFLALSEDPLENHSAAVLGLGHRFDFGLEVEAEVLYNGAAADDLAAGFARVAAGRALHASAGVLGALASYELLPTLQGSLAWLFSLTDLSSVLQPGLVLSVSDEADLLAGAIIGLGARPRGFRLESEFGTYPNFYFMEFKLYF